MWNGLDAGALDHRNAMILLATLEFSDGGLRFAIFFATLFPAMWLASRQSTYLVDYYIFVACLNRFVRRVLDWAGGQFDGVPISSLLPLILGALMLLVVIQQQHKFSRTVRQPLRFFGAALVYAFVIGVGNGLGAFVSLLNYLTPLATLYYGLAVRADTATFDRWIKVLTLVAVGVAAYGWFQWATLPPWDEAWIHNANMRSLGRAEAYRLSVFSMLESRGPYAGFLSLAAVPLLASAHWRRKALGMPAGIFIALSILPSTVRSAWGTLVIGVVSFSVLKGGRSTAQLLGVFAVLVVALLVFKSRIPASERLYDRIESLSNVSADGSFQGRVNIALKGPEIILSRPQGYGLGSSGVGGRIGGGVVAADNGFIELAATFGLPGLVGLVAGMRILVRELYRIHKQAQSEYTVLALAWLVSRVAGLMIANTMVGPYAGMALLPIGVVLAADQSARQHANANALQSAPSGAPWSPPDAQRWSPGEGS